MAPPGMRELGPDVQVTHKDDTVEYHFPRRSGFQAFLDGAAAFLGIHYMFWGFWIFLICYSVVFHIVP